MKKPLLFLTVLVFFGNTVNAQEMKVQLISKEKIAQTVSLEQISNKAKAAEPMLLERKNNKAEIVKFKNLVTEINRAEVRQPMSLEQRISKADAKNSALGGFNRADFIQVINSEQGEQVVNRAPSRAPGDVIFSENFESSSSMSYDPVATGWLCFWDVLPWYTHSGFAYNSAMGMGMQFDDEDDKSALAITPGFTLTAGVTYNVQFWLEMGYNATDGDDLAVTIGRTRTVDGMLNNFDSFIYHGQDVFTNGWVLISQSFTPTISGTYYLGFYGYTPTGYGWYISVDNILVVDASTSTSCTTPVSTFPWTEGFESTTGTAMPACWTVTHTGTANSWISVGNTGNNVPGVSGTVPTNSGSRMLALGYEQSGRNACAFSQGLHLIAGTAYSVKFWLRMPGYLQDSEYNGLECKVVQTASLAGMNSGSLIYTKAATAPGISAWTECSGIFIPTTTGTYYLGFRDLTTQSNWGFYTVIDDISISATSFIDAAITAITAPPVSGTDLTATETVTATIKNNGTSPINSIGLELRVNGNLIATETRTGTIAAGAEVNYTFTAKANLSAAGNHTVAVKAVLAGDQNPANDSYSITVNNVVCNVTSLPYVQNFDNEPHDYPLCWTMISNNVVNGYNGTSDYTMGIYSWMDNPADKLFVFSSYSNVSGMAADRYYQYLISPELPANDGLYITFDVETFFQDGFADPTLRMGFSSTTNNIAAFTWFEPDVLESGYVYQGLGAILPISGVKYFAINYMVNQRSNLLVIDNIVIDNMPLMVVSVTPDEDATNVAIDAEVSVTFNYDITANNLSAISINNGISVTPRIEGNKLIIAHSNFAHNTEYTVNIMAGAIYGYTEAISWSFRTEIENSIPVINGNEINIYQNNGEIFVKVSENSEIRLLDIYGRVLGSYNVDANSTLNMRQPAGIYLLEVRHNGNVSTHKVVVR